MTFDSGVDMHHAKVGRVDDFCPLNELTKLAKVSEDINF
jgi:hypothetical protein